MKIEMTDKQYEAIRGALISAKVELEYAIENSEGAMRKLRENRLEEVNAAMEATDVQSVKLIF